MKKKSSRLDSHPCKECAGLRSDLDIATQKLEELKKKTEMLFLIAGEIEKRNEATPSPLAASNDFTEYSYGYFDSDGEDQHYLASEEATASNTSPNNALRSGGVEPEELSSPLKEAILRSTEVISLSSYSP